MVPPTLLVIVSGPQVFVYYMLKYIHQRKTILGSRTLYISFCNIYCSTGYSKIADCRVAHNERRDFVPMNADKIK